MKKIWLVLVVFFMSMFMASCTESEGVALRGATPNVENVKGTEKGKVIFDFTDELVLYEENGWYIQTDKCYWCVSKDFTLCKEKDLKRDRMGNCDPDEFIGGDAYYYIKFVKYDDHIELWRINYNTVNVEKHTVKALITTYDYDWNVFIYNGDSEPTLSWKLGKKS